MRGGGIVREIGETEQIVDCVSRDNTRNASLHILGDVKWILKF